ncbi:MAG: choice-of-anchor B family protein [Anaerolineae bacterium]|nr:choice-of-anchor B family protein [Anaerolineae bacterium]
MDNLTIETYPEETEGAENLTPRMQAFLEDKEPVQNLQPMGLTECVGGMAGSYPCNNVDLLAFMPLASIGGGSGNDSWGWTGCGNREFALMGRSSGTSFVEITDPVNPIYLGNLPTHTSNSSWRDIKTYNDYAFIVSEAGGHGMQVFDLSQLCNVPSPPVTFVNSAHYNGFGNAHNLVINEDSGYAYGVGTGTCSGGLHMVNIQNPLSPSNAGCFSADGYTHDAQCVIYNGPDTQHQGKEICFNSNEDTLTIVDVTNKAAPAQISRTGYAGSGYTHQGWLTEDQVHFLLDDELDESNFGHNTRTYVWNLTDLDNPALIGNYTASVAAIDHNQYVRGNYVFQANYRAGLRILDITNVATANLFEEAYFDIYPANNNANFNGAWNTYPYFESGVVIISGIGEGLFIVQPTSLPGPNPVPCDSPADIPWLSVSPVSGSTAENDGTPVDIIFDSTGLTPGEYTASLCIGSNALTTPELFVPVALTVADSPEIMITSPLSGSVLTAVNGVDISATIAVTTPNFTVPDDGHWHLWLDGVDTGPVLDYAQSVTLTVGTHVISAQLQYPDHTPVGPVDTIQVEVVGADIIILSPADGAVLTATNGVNISTTVTVTTPNFVIPADGHWHLWLDGVDTGPVSGDSTTITLTVGTHVITAQLQAPDHTPLGPVDTITVTVVAGEGQTMFYIYMPVIQRDE